MFSSNHEHLSQCKDLYLMQPHWHVPVHYLQLKYDTRNLPRAIPHRIRERTRLPVASRRAGICQGLVRKSVLIVNRSTGSADRLRIFPSIMRRETIRGVFPFFFSLFLSFSLPSRTIIIAPSAFLRLDNHSAISSIA